MHRTGEPKEGSTKHLLHDDGDDDQSLWTLLTLVVLNLRFSVQEFLVETAKFNIFNFTFSVLEILVETAKFNIISDDL